jgi:predicted phosphoadenosine phosphosulfate sulfurtransferase
MKAQTKTQWINITEVFPNDENPRYISEAKFLQMVKSLQDFPEMASVRPLIINENNLVLGGNMRLKAMQEAGWKDVPVIKVAWSEESPTRYCALTTAATYKHVTWGKILNRKIDHYTFYPIYDWTYVDVWKAIHDNGWPYNDVYNYQYRYGIKIQNMRVSNLHHETALKSLFYLQEVEPQTWEKLCKRLSGINTIKHLKNDAVAAVSDLPEAFESWKEYAYYLLENLVTDLSKREVYRKKFESLEKRYANLVHNKDNLYKTMVTTVIVNDYHFTKLNNWERNPELNAWRHYDKKGTQPQKQNKYIHG